MPLISKESPLSEDNLDKLLNSDYAKSLDSLKAHVKGHKVINSTIGNAGFILYLDNNSWALAFRIIIKFPLNLETARLLKNQ